MAKPPSPWKKRIRARGVPAGNGAANGSLDRAADRAADGAADRAAEGANGDHAPGLSETLLAFAKPLIDGLPGDPPTLEQVRQAMHYASIVWNVHLLAADDPQLGAEVCSMLDEVPDDLGADASTTLDAMLDARRTKYARDRRFASLEVVQAEGGWNVIAEGAEVE